MRCNFCGFEFTESESKSACYSCPLSKGKGHCKLLKCPNCGYETPAEPKWVKFLKERIKW
ncbi:TPA: hypothetical protein EYP66_12875 [Candidatus Poribacteria bacterium]|nr:hypothetical protein [Candidatus Poribacteria bacterium]